MHSKLLLKYTEEELRYLDLPSKIIAEGNDHGRVRVTLNDGTTVTKPTRQMILLLIGLRAHLYLKVPLRKSHFDYSYTGIIPKNKKFIAWSDYYTELIDITNIDHRIIYKLFADSVNYLHNMIVKWFGPYQQSMSILSLCRIQCDSKIHAITEKPITDKQTQFIEREIAIRTKQLIETLSDPELIKNNILLPFMRSGALKKNQIPQQMIAYGTRSDIDDTMMMNFVESSAISGLKNITEYGVEGLSVKKSEHYKKSVIRDSQYSNRGTRLNCAILPHRYSGDCGSKLLLPYVIPERSAENYIDKVVFFNGERIVVSKKTLPILVGQQVQMISPLGCRYIDGVCERCAGRATSKPWAFIPDVHLGIYAATKVGEAVAQMVLSAKHLIRTKSIGYELTEQAEPYFEIEGSCINISKAICKSIKDWKLKIPIKFFGYMAGSGDKLKIEESFNEVAHITIIKEDGEEMVDMSNERVFPYFSAKFLNYLRNKYSELVVTKDNEYIIPMSDFNIRWPIMKFNVINDDMVSYTKECDDFIKSRVGQYTTATSALHDLASVIYSKSSINIFYIEVLLRTMMRKTGDKPGLPVVEDLDNVRFEGICKNITTHTLSHKLIYERIGMTSKSDGLLSSPEVSLIDKEDGLYDPLLFGFND